MAVGLPGKVVFTGELYRSVWYCHALNEPFVMSFQNHKDKEAAKLRGDSRLKKCEYCGVWPDPYDNEIEDFAGYLDFMDSNHTYICTVRKP